MTKTRAIVAFFIALVTLVVLAVLVTKSAAVPSNENPPIQSDAKPGGVTENLNGCTRVFNEAVLTQSEVVFQNQTATIFIRGYGQIKIELYDKDAPKTVENFVRLARSGFYNCLTFHRLARGFVIQGGDPEGTGMGGRTASEEVLVDELDPNTASYKQGYVKGVVAMANKSFPNTGSSQFFIMLGDSALDHRYTIFGKVVEGLSVLDQLNTLEIAPVLGPLDGSPKLPVVMEKVEIGNK